MKEVRCLHNLKNGKPCNKKLGQFTHVNGEIHCPRCKNINHLSTSIECRRVS